MGESRELVPVNSVDAGSHQGWKHRIIKREQVPPESLIANPKNFRRHPESQARAFRKIVKKIGFIASVTANARTRRIINGHLRVQEAIRRKQPLIDVEWVDLSEDEERIALAMFDPISEMADIDTGKLDAVLKDAEKSLGVDSEAIEEIRKSFLGHAAESEDPEGSEEGGEDSGQKPGSISVVAHCANELQQVQLIEWAESVGVDFKVVII